MKKSIGTCIYCGQTQYIEHMEDMTDAELDREATKRCTCDLGEKARQAEASAECAVDNINSLFGADFPEVAAILKCSVVSLLKGEVRGISIDTGKKVTAKLSKTLKGDVKVERVEKNNSVLVG